VLDAFTGNRGENPYGGVVRDSAGNLYGTTYQGGKSNAGVVYRLNKSNEESVLYTFTGPTDGSNPQNGVIRDSAGNLYGTAYQGGTDNWGTVFKVDSSKQFSVLHTFTRGTDGLHPLTGNLLLDSDGNLYGTCGGGGAYGQGIIYELDAAGDETILYNFTGGIDGSTPFGGVIRDSKGNLYGTTACGGEYGVGVAYKLSTSGELTVSHIHGR
jgi:uncharacterized repeat protein (TIGR03803 family)